MRPEDRSVEYKLMPARVNGQSVDVNRKQTARNHRREERESGDRVSIGRSCTVRREMFLVKEDRKWSLETDNN